MPQGLPLGDEPLCFHRRRGRLLGWPLGRRRHPHWARVQRFLVGSLPAASGREIRFTGTTVLRVENGRIAEEVSLDYGVIALQQLGILKVA
jgi:hypothetical protein